MDGYDVFFNILFTSFNGWTPAFVSVGGLVLAIGIWAIDGNRGVKVIASTVAGFVAFFAALIAWSSWLQFNDLRAAFRDGHVESAHGVVHYGERGKFDRFTLEGHAFEFGPGEGSGGFNETVVESGPNLEGRCVLIYYEPNSNAVVWLGIRHSSCNAGEISAPPPAQRAPALPAGPPPRT